MLSKESLNHVGLIPDGIRRWARENKTSLDVAYWQAMQIISQSIDKFFLNGVYIVSVYVLSKENLSRVQTDLEPVIDAESRLFSELLPTIATKYDCEVIHVGNSQLLPDRYWEPLNALCSPKSKRNGRKLYLLAAYNPIDEIQYSLGQSEHLADFTKYLWVQESVDVIIRTGKEQRTSNFLPLQSANARLVFLNKFWNNVTADDLLEAALNQ